MRKRHQNERARIKQISAALTGHAFVPHACLNQSEWKPTINIQPQLARSFCCISYCNSVTLAHFEEFSGRGRWIPIYFSRDAKLNLSRLRFTWAKVSHALSTGILMTTMHTNWSISVVRRFVCWMKCESTDNFRAVVFFRVDPRIRRRIDAILEAHKTVP